MVLAHKMLVLRVYKLVKDTQLKWKGDGNVSSYDVPMLHKTAKLLKEASVTRYPKDLGSIAKSIYATPTGERFGCEAIAYYTEHGLHTMEFTEFCEKMHELNNPSLPDNAVQEAETARLDSLIRITTTSIPCSCVEQAVDPKCLRHGVVLLWQQQEHKTLKRALEIIEKVQLVANMQQSLSDISSTITPSFNGESSIESRTIPTSFPIHFDHSSVMQMKRKITRGSLLPIRGRT